MQQSGQNDYNAGSNLLCLVPVKGPTQECTNEASCQREQVQYVLRDAPGVYLALIFVVGIEEECYDAKAKEPAGVKWQPFSSEV